MKIKISKEWLSKHLNKELPDEDFSAGSLVLDTFDAGDGSQPELKVAFGTLVFLWRNEKNLSAEKLADRADIDEDEVKRIENDETYRPETRTVCAIATLMKVPEIKLLQLSGNVVPTDISLTAESLAFAANAKRWNEVTKEQRRLLHSFLKFLSKR